MPSYFTGKRVDDPELVQSPASTFRDFIEEFTKSPVRLSVTSAEYQAMSKAEKSKAKMVGYVVACTFPDSPWKGRKQEHACPCDLIIIDMDNSADARAFVDEPSLAHKRLDGLNFAIYHTASSTKEKPRLRVVVEADAIPVNRYPDAVLTIAGLMGLSEVTPESTRPHQPMYHSTVFSDYDDFWDDPPVIAKHFDGRPFTVSDISTDTENLPPPSSGNKPATAQRSTDDAVDDWLPHYEPPDPRHTIQTVKGMLPYIDADCSRMEWLEIAAALQHQFGSTEHHEAYTLFDEWSAQGTKYEGEQDTAKVWRSFSQTPKGRAPITIATLIMRAKAGGWKKPISRHTSTGTGPHLPPLPPICCAADLIVEESVTPRPQQLVQGLLHIGEKWLLAGASKSYKSWALLDLACSVGTGTPFWGLPTTQGSVLLLNYEIRPWFFAKRLERVAKAKGCGLLHNVHVWNLRGKRADFGRVLLELRGLLKSTAFVLVIIDPLYSGLAGRSENDAAEMAAFMNSIEELTELGPAVALGHHFAKGNSAMRDSIDRASGSGVFARDPDDIVTLNRHQTEGAFVADFTLRNFAPMASRGLRLNFPLLLPDASLDVEKIKGAQVRSKAAVTVEAIVALLPKSGGLRTAELSKIAQEETGVSASRFYTLLSDAKKLGLIRKSGSLNERAPTNSTVTPQLLQEYSEE